MENILRYFNEKIISLTENYLKSYIFEKGISGFTDDLIAEFAKFGSDLTQYLVEYVEEEIFNLEERKEKFESLEKDYIAKIAELDEEPNVSLNMDQLDVYNGFDKLKDEMYK